MKKFKKIARIYWTLDVIRVVRHYVGDECDLMSIRTLDFDKSVSFPCIGAGEVKVTYRRSLWYDIYLTD